jgi:hypothetical protein
MFYRKAVSGGRHSQQTSAVGRITKRLGLPFTAGWPPSREPSKLKFEVCEKHELASYGEQARCQMAVNGKEKYIKQKVEKASTNNPVFGWSCTMPDLQAMQTAR